MVKRGRIGQRDIKALGPDQTIWDSAVSGYGARRQRSDARTYFVFIARQRGASVGTRLAGTVPHGHLN
jgi:hypothetical protein